LVDSRVRSERYSRIQVGYQESTLSATTGQTENAAQRAHRVIRDRIVDGKLPGGSMLSENVLAADLGCSRTPVRSALQRLEEEGWVTIYPQRGALVRTFTEQDAREVTGARHLLESGGVRAADPRARAALCDRLDALVDAQAAAVRERNRDGFVELSMQFHSAFVEAAGNRLLLEFADRLKGRQAVLLHLSLAAVHEADDDIVDEHRALVAACRRGDLDRFAALLDDHMNGDRAARRGLT
jgi:DNA-binding GntR family transcriptional regulator